MTDCVKTWHCRKNVQWLASASTLCRFGLIGRLPGGHEVLLDQFIASFKRAPKKLIHFDATDDPVHGEQDGRFFHGYYRHLATVCILRSSVAGELSSSEQRIDGAKHSWAILSLLVKSTAASVAKGADGDGGFCRWKMLRWCDASRGRLHHRTG